jgi:hypothetical protein
MAGRDRPVLHRRSRRASPEPSLDRLDVER